MFTIFTPPSLSLAILSEELSFPKFIVGSSPNLNPNFSKGHFIKIDSNEINMAPKLEFTSSI